MAKRRGDGEGSVYQSKDGRWRAEISLGYKPDGKKRRKVVYGRTRVDVADQRKKLLRDQQLGINVKLEKQTLAGVRQRRAESGAQGSEAPRIRTHDLRHSAATLPLVQGVHPKLVQGMLGHSRFQLTMDTYSHVLPALRNEVAARMDDVFAPTPTSAPTKSTAEQVQ